MSNISFTEQESRSIGALMGFVFNLVLGYTQQKDRCKVEELGIKTAARFINGPVTEFTDEIHCKSYRNRVQ